MRLFIAINFEAHVVRRLAKLRGHARDYDPHARFSPDENLHLTLAFLGEVAPERVGAIERAMKNLRAEPFCLRIGGRERLGDGLLCLAVQREPQLMRLQAELCAALEREGFSMEAREFRPHITLARDYHADYTPPATPIFADVHRISLMRSQRAGGRMVYTELYCKNLF